MLLIYYFRRCAYTGIFYCRFFVRLRSARRAFPFCYFFFECG